MKSFWVVLLIFLFGAGATAGFFYGRHSAASQAAKDDATTAPSDSGDDVAATATVRVVPLETASITKTVIAYGIVVAEPSEINVCSVPYESRVNRVLVLPGQAVLAGAPLVEIAPSADAQLQYRQAISAVDAARRDLSQMQARFNDHLATSQDLLQSQQNLEQAQLKQDSMESSGVAGTHQLLAVSNGIVNKIDVQDGQVVSAGSALVETAPENKIEVKLGMEPVEASILQTNFARAKDPLAVKLMLVQADNQTAITGTVKLITQRVNPDTRLVDVYVALPSDISMPLGAFVQGELMVASQQGLVAPRNAVLPDDSGYVLFTVKDNLAVKHEVEIGLENDDQVLVKSDDLKPGDPVVIEGNYELDDKMAVAIAPDAGPTTAPTDAATEPATDLATQPAEAKP